MPMLAVLLGAVAAHGQSALDVARNVGNAATATLGGIDFCGDVTADELRRVDCGTRSNIGAPIVFGPHLASWT